MFNRYDIRKKIVVDMSIVDAEEIYDIRGRLENDESFNGATTTSMNGATILSSAPSSNEHNINIQIIPSDITLSLSPSMVDSSVLIPNNETSTTGSSLSASFDDMISLISSCDASSYSDDVPLANVGRSLALASISCDASTSSSREESSGVVMGAVMWWERLRSDRDWAEFRKKANDYLNVLIEEEIKSANIRSEQSIGASSSADKISTIKGKKDTDQNNPHWALLMQWCQGIYDSVNASILGLTTRNGSAKTKYFSMLMAEVIQIKQELDNLPPPPPSFPDGVSLDELSDESRNKLIQYQESLDAWRQKVMPQREELSKKYLLAQEKLLALIIDQEEDTFHGYCGSKDEFGAMNDDGFVVVRKTESCQWDHVNQALVARSKCNLTTLFLAAVTASAALFVTIQRKKL